MPRDQLLRDQLLRDQLLETLDKYEIPTFQFDTPEGATAVVTQRGARLLGMFPCCAGKTNSVLWVNPNLAAILSGQSEDWSGTGVGGMGGDRLWLAPERNFYYRKPRAFEDWFAQLAMDPGAYEKTNHTGKSATFRNTFSLRDHLQDRVIDDVKVERTLSLLENPLKELESADSLKDNVSAICLETRERVTAPEPTDELPPSICPWGLTQVPPPDGEHPGTVIVPTRHMAEPVPYFGPVSPKRLQELDDHVAFKIDSREICKIGVRAEDLPQSGPAQIAFLRPASKETAETLKARDLWSLLIRESEQTPRTSENALDPAVFNPEGPRGVIQSYNHDASGPARFGEIEVMYMPLLSEESGLWSSTATSRIMAFLGGKTDILRLAREKLGIRNIHLFI